MPTLSPASVSYRVGDRVNYEPLNGSDRAGVVVAVYPGVYGQLVVWVADDGSGHDATFADDLVLASEVEPAA